MADINNSQERAIGVKVFNEETAVRYEKTTVIKEKSNEKNFK